MKKVDITFLPSVKDNYFDDKLLIDWSRKLNDSFDFINTYIPKNAKEARTYLKKSNAAFGVILSLIHI